MRISDWSSDVCSSDLAIGTDQQVAVAAQGLEVLLLAFEVDGHAARDALGLQDLQQLLAGEAAEAVAAGPDAFAIGDHVDLVPVSKTVANRLVGIGILGEELVQRLEIGRAHV